MIDLTNAIQQLRDELENLNVSIRAFERLAATGTFCKRSRSPKWPAEASPKKRAGESGGGKKADHSRKGHQG